MNPYHFQHWGGEHAVVILLTFLLPIFSIRWSKGQTELHRDLLGKGLAVMLVANWCTYQGYRMYCGYWSVQYDLPMELCNWAVWLTAYALWYKKQRAAELAFFWVMAGSIHGVITPDIHEPFPHLTYVTFMVGHTGLIWSVMYVALGMNLKPQKGAWLRAMGWSQLYFITAITINFFANSNYGYLRQKPIGGSFLDLLHPWPYYLLELEIIGAISYALVYFPFWWWRRKNEPIL